MRCRRVCEDIRPLPEHDLRDCGEPTCRRRDSKPPFHPSPAAHSLEHRTRPGWHDRPRKNIIHDVSIDDCKCLKFLVPKCEVAITTFSYIFPQLRTCISCSLTGSVRTLKARRTVARDTTSALMESTICTTSARRSRRPLCREGRDGVRSQRRSQRRTSTSITG